MGTVHQYRQLWAHELRQIAHENWSSLSELKKIEKVLKPRRTSESRSVRAEVEARIAILEQNQLQDLQEGLRQVQATMAEIKRQYLRPVYFPTDDVLQIPYLLPDEQAGERWLLAADLQQLAAQLGKGKAGQRPETINKFSKFGYLLRVEIRSKRHYAVPTEGKAVLRTSDSLQTLLNLQEIRFVQEGVTPPAVYLRFSFGVPAAIGIVRITPKMGVEGFQEFSGSEYFQTLIESISLAYYRDLVVPGEVRQSRFQPRSSNYVPRPRGNQSRELPRDRSIRQFRYISDWHHQQERAQHQVIGHIRWIDRNFVADSERQHMAQRALGKRLPDGFTWVKTHERGVGNHHDVAVSLHDLEERTYFYPPKRATKELEDLLT